MKYQTEIVQINKLKLNDKNPRKINDGKLKQLEKSLRDFPQMLDIRPIVVDGDYVVLGGNMRLQAAINIGLTSIPIIKAETLTESQMKEFVIKDNISFGEWDWEFLQYEWKTEPLGEWGLDAIQFEDFDVDEFFEKAVNDSNDDSEKTKIYLEYVKEDFDEFTKLIKNHSGTKEEIILKLLRG
jgi:hypothetical protein